MQTDATLLGVVGTCCVRLHGPLGRIETLTEAGCLYTLDQILILKYETS